MKNTFYSLSSLAIIATSTLVSARADTVTLYDNTSASVAGFDHIRPGVDNGPLFQSFLSGSVASTLNSVDLSLANTGSGTSDTVSVALYSDAPTSYGSWIAYIGTITDSSITSAGGLYSVSLTANPTLAANTRYWIGLNETSTGSAVWNGAPDATGTGVAGQYYYNVGGYQANSTSGNNPYIMKVTATTAVPEPTSTALVGLACLGVGVWLRQRRSN